VIFLLWSTNRVSLSGQGLRGLAFVCVILQCCCMNDLLLGTSGTKFASRCFEHDLLQECPQECLCSQGRACIVCITYACLCSVLEEEGWHRLACHMGWSGSTLL
jgi:hypothetical protein